jgi:hypothetical protein
MEPLKAVKTSRLGRRALVLIGIGVVSAGSVAGVSFALTSGSTPSASAQTTSTAQSTSQGTSKSSAAANRRQRIEAILRRSVSGQIELSTKNGFVTYDFDRGVVTSFSSSSITVLRADSQSVTEAVTGSTRMPKRGVPTKGENVVVISTGGNAIRIVDLDPLQGAKSGTSTSGQTSVSSALNSLT